MAYETQYDAATTVAFQKRVVVALFAAALTVMGEDQGTYSVRAWRARYVFARTVFDDYATVFTRVLFAVVADDTTTLASTDAEIYVRLLEVWNDLALVAGNNA